MTRIKATMTAAFAATALAVTGVAIAQHASQPAMQGHTQTARAAARLPEVLVIAFHADWCPNCQTLGPKLEKGVFPELTSEPYLFVELDMTSRESNEAEYMLAALGLGNLWETYGRKTGFAVVVDPRTKKVLHTFTAGSEPADMVRDIRAAANS